MGRTIEEIKIVDREPILDLKDRLKYVDYNPLKELPHKIKLELRKETAAANKRKVFSSEAWARL